MKRGKLITLEGPDGCGKSTLARGVEQALGKQLACQLDWEPTDGPIGKLIRAHSADNDLPPQSFLFLFLADRYHHLQSRITPALAKGFWVILDRYMDSTWAYQSAHCGLDVVGLKRWTESFQGFLVPDRTYLLEVPYDVARRRLKDRKQLEANDRAGESFYQDIAQRFLTLAKVEPQRYCRLDGTQSIEVLTRQVMEDLKPWM